MERIIMARIRFKKQLDNSFFGNMIYDRMVQQDLYLRQLDEIVSWVRFTEQYVELYIGGVMYGRPPNYPAIILKMLF